MSDFDYNWGSTASDIARRKLENRTSYERGEHSYARDRMLGESGAYDLNDLEDSQEFMTVAQRFLESVGTDEDIFEYLRDSNLNTYSAFARLSQSNKWTQRQKEDYAYLRSKFDNAEIGGMDQFLGLLADGAVDFVTDPLLILSVIMTPFTGGGSLVAQQTTKAGVTQGLRMIGTSSLKPVSRTKLNKMIKDGSLAEAARKQSLAVGGWGALEGSAFLGLHNYASQNTDLNVGLRQQFSNKEFWTSVGMGGALGGLGSYGLQKWANHRNPVLQLANKDSSYTNSALYHLSKVWDSIKANTVVGNAARLRTYSNVGSDKARQLANLFDHDSQLKIGSRSTEKINWSFPEQLNRRRGNYLFDDSGFWNAIDPIIKSNQRVRKIDEENVYALLTNGKWNKNNKLTSRARVSGTKGKVTKAQIETASRLRTFFERIRQDALDAGYNVNKVENYFPRSWNPEKIRNNRRVFEDRLVEKRIVKRSEVSKVVDEMLNKNNQMYSSHGHMLNHGRKFKNLKEKDFAEFLNTDLLEVTVNYTMNAANAIQKELSFFPGRKAGTARVGNVRNLKQKDGSNILELRLYNESQDKRFNDLWIQKIDDEVFEKTGGKQRLSSRERKNLLDSFKYSVGDVQYRNNRWTQGAYDTLKLANSMAYLPLATVSSLTEGLIAVARTPNKTGVKNLIHQLENGGSIITTDLKTILVEKRGMSKLASQREANRVGIAFDDIQMDSVNRLAGEPLQTGWTKKGARAFFKLNLLMPWTRNVELAAFQTGRDLIEENLKVLAKLQDDGIKIFDDVDLFLGSINKQNSKKAKEALENSIEGVYTPKGDMYQKVTYLKETLFDLGVDPKEAMRWFRNGANKESDYWVNEIGLAGARFSRSVIIPTSREFSKVPHFMNHPKWDILTQFLRYPAAFSNTVLKNFARDALNRPGTNIPSIVAFVTASTGIARYTNYWRASDEKRDEIDYASGRYDEMLKRRIDAETIPGKILDSLVAKSAESNLRAFQRVGLLGFTEYGLRFSDAISRTGDPWMAGAGLLGPVVGDVARTATYGTGLFETIARKAPGYGAKNVIKRYTGWDPYTDFIEDARELDKVVYESIFELEDEGFDYGRYNYYLGGEVSVEVPTAPLSPLEQSNVYKTDYFNYMVNHPKYDVSVNGALGILGNIDKETGLEELGWRGSYDYKQKQIDGPGIGLFMLDPSGSHLTQYKDFLERNNIEDSGYAQIDYALESIYDTESPALLANGAGHAKHLRDIIKNGTAEEVAVAFAERWERPRDYITRDEKPEAWMKNRNERISRTSQVREELQEHIAKVYEDSDSAKGKEKDLKGKDKE